MSGKGESWSEQWGSGNYGYEGESGKTNSKNKKMAEAKAVASKGLVKAKSFAAVGADKAKVAAAIGAQKVKSGTSFGIKWIKSQYQKRTSK